LVALILLSFAAPVAGAPFDNAYSAYERGDYTTALRLFRSLAEGDDTLSKAMIGLMYKNGQGVPQNSIEAAKWLRKAAEQGDVDAQLMNRPGFAGGSNS
jgi:hypothetical protein